MVLTFLSPERFKICTSRPANHGSCFYNPEKFQITKNYKRDPWFLIFWLQKGSNFAIFDQKIMVLIFMILKISRFRIFWRANHGSCFCDSRKVWISRDLTCWSWSHLFGLTKNINKSQFPKNLTDKLWFLALDFTDKLWFLAFDFRKTQILELSTCTTNYGSVFFVSKKVQLQKYRLTFHGSGLFDSNKVQISRHSTKESWFLPFWRQKSLNRENLGSIHQAMDQIPWCSSNFLNLSQTQWRTINIIFNKIGWTIPTSW